MTVTFVLATLFLSGTSLITLVESLRTSDAVVRNIMNVESTVSVIASFVYMRILDMLKQKESLQDIQRLRYLDWSMTTPLLILGLCLFMTGSSMPSSTFIFLTFANMSMLLFGYLGEFYDMPHAIVLSWVAYIVLFSTIYTTFYANAKPFQQRVFWFVAITWLFYGLVQQHPNEHERHAAYNILDIISKACVGIIMWSDVSDAVKWTM